MRRLFAAGLALCIGLSVGCGGGGGGGSEPTVPYTGITTEARVTAANAEDIAALALGGTDLESFGGIAFRQGSGRLETGGAEVLRAVLRVRDIALGTWQGRAERRAQRPMREAWSDPGPCGGTVSFDVTADDQTGLFNGSIFFRDYQDCDGSLLRGGTQFSGQIDLALGEPLYMTLSFGTLAYEDTQDHFAMGGSMFFDFRGPTEVLQMTVNVRDDVDGKSFRFQDYRIETTVTGGGADVVISGRCYHPDHGYVVVQTVQPLHVPLTLEFPSSGTIRADGVGGTWLVLTALSAEQCQVQADTDGNGFEDWNSGAILWTNL